jgi:hypothetical protein
MLCCCGSIYVAGFRLFVVKWWDYWWTGKDLEGISCDLIEVRSLHLPGDWGKLRKTSVQITHVLIEIFYGAPSQHKSRTLMLLKELIAVYSFPSVTWSHSCACRVWTRTWRTFPVFQMHQATVCTSSAVWWSPWFWWRPLSFSWQCS